MAFAPQVVLQKFATMCFKVDFILFYIYMLPDIIPNMVPSTGY